MSPEDITTWISAAAVGLSTAAIALVKLRSAWKSVAGALGLPDAGNLYAKVLEIHTHVQEYGGRIDGLDSRVSVLERACPVASATAAVSTPVAPAAKQLDS
jgi:phosphotransacetylase